MLSVSFHHSCKNNAADDRPRVAAPTDSLARARSLQTPDISAPVLNRVRARTRERVPSRALPLVAGPFSLSLSLSHRANAIERQTPRGTTLPDTALTTTGGPVHICRGSSSSTRPPPRRTLFSAPSLCLPWREAGSRPSPHHPSLSGPCRPVSRIPHTAQHTQNTHIHIYI